MDFWLSEVINVKYKAPGQSSANKSPMSESAEWLVIIISDTVSDILP